MPTKVMILITHFQIRRPVTVEKLNTHCYTRLYEMPGRNAVFGCIYFCFVFSCLFVFFFFLFGKNLHFIKRRNAANGDKFGQNVGICMHIAALRFSCGRVTRPESTAVTVQIIVKLISLSRGKIWKRVSCYAMK